MYVGPDSGNKRDEKATENLQEQMEKESVKSGASRVSNKSFGNALKGAVGIVFIKNGINFIVLDKFDNSGTNKIVQCQTC